MNNLTKNIFIVLIISIALFLIVFNIFSNKNKSQNSIIFSYPWNELKFAWEKLPNLEKNYLIKERFDKEFLNTSYNLYQFFLYIKRIPIYMPYIEYILEKNNIPNDFKYLPIAESAFKNDAISNANAAWIWQFIPETAREYWLIINDNIDERYNFEKSTIAAAKYLKYLHNIFNNWTLVAASYNRWQNWIKKALKEQNVDNYYDLYLNEETSRYVFKILAIKYVIEDYLTKKDYIDKIIGWVYTQPKTEIIKLWKTDNLKKWAKDNWYNYLTIKTLNMWILKDSLPDWEWEVKVIK